MDAAEEASMFPPYRGGSDGSQLSWESEDRRLLTDGQLSILPVDVAVTAVS